MDFSIQVTFSSVDDPTATTELMLTPEELKEIFSTGWQHKSTTVLKWNGANRVLQHHYVKDCGYVQAKFITRHNMFDIVTGQRAE